MASVTGKRKREVVAGQLRPVKKPASQPGPNVLDKKKLDGKNLHKGAPARQNGKSSSIHLQIVTGSYERVLHGISAHIPRLQLHKTPSVTKSQNGADEARIATSSQVSFSDTFLFAAHSSAVRCLAISPPTEEADKRYLATGSSDERINVYSLSTAPPPPAAVRNPGPPSLTGTATAENPRNRSLGSLVHHDRAITRLHFPARAKLFSAAEDATIAISRTRDWTVLSSIKAPIPKPQGRPSGDTAGPGEIPAGVNDFAIHPSQKLMISVGRGEKCMRLWNLMTGKKAGVLNFDRELLSQAGEGKFSSGEGRRLLWDRAGENYVVGFEKGAVLFGINSEPKAIVKLSPPSKIHQMRCLMLPGSDRNVLAISTEDGRICFFDTDAFGPGDKGKLPIIPCLSQLGGPAAGISGRVKDFEIVPIPNHEDDCWVIVAASSDGAIRLWTVTEDEITPQQGTATAPKQVGRLIATQETGERITCLGAFVLDGAVSDMPFEANGADEEDASEASEDGGDE